MVIHLLRGMAVVAVDTRKKVDATITSGTRTEESFTTSENTAGRTRRTCPHILFTNLMETLNCIGNVKDQSVYLIMYRSLAKPVTPKLTDPTKATSNTKRCPTKALI